MQLNFAVKSFIIAIAILLSTANVLCAQSVGGKKEDWPDLRTVNNYIFWCSYTFDFSDVKERYINGIQGMSDHGHTYELKSGGAISVYTGYLMDYNEDKEQFQSSVAQCQKITGFGIFKHLYLCEDKIIGCMVHNMPIRSEAQYIITYYRDSSSNAWQWDWNALKLIVQTFRLIDGEEFSSIYHALYPETSIEQYKLEIPRAGPEVW